MVGLTPEGGAPLPASPNPVGGDPRSLRMPASRWDRTRTTLRSPAGRRSGWVIVDQGVSSLTNLMASMLVARSVTEQLFGAFSFGILIYIIVVNLTRALVSQPLAIRVSARSHQVDEVAAAAERLAREGIDVVQDRCLMVELQYAA